MTQAKVLTHKKTASVCQGAKVVSGRSSLVKGYEMNSHVTMSMVGWYLVGSVCPLVSDMWISYTG